MAWQGHFWTIAPTLLGAGDKDEAMGGRRWSTSLHDPDRGRVRLSGWLHEQGSRTLVVLLHGLGGTSSVLYVRDAARVALARGHDCLRMAMRGAERDGEDIHHAGLTRDIHATLESVQLEGYERIVLIGFSLGGHLMLRATAEVELDPRVTTTIAVCSPLDLQTGSTTIDHPRATVYREYVLRALRQMYKPCARRGRAPSPWSEVRGVRTVRAWDERTVVPRFGFGSADAYYRAMSAANVLGELKRPCLYVGSSHDPMVTRASVEPSLRLARPGHMEVRWIEDGGHVYMPARVDLGMGGEETLISQALTWASRQG